MEFKLSRTDTDLRIALDGDFSDGLAGRLDHLASQIDRPVLHFDFTNLRRINSHGIRDWSVFYRRAAAGRQVHFHSCPVVLIDYLRIVAGLQSGAAIESLLVTCWCNRCERNEGVIMVATELIAKAAFVEKACNTCGGPLQPEADIDLFLEVLIRPDST